MNILCGLSNQQPLDCLPNKLFRLTSKETWMMCITGPLWGQSKGYQVSLTKDQQCGKRFHVMTSSFSYWRRFLAYSTFQNLRTRFTFFFCYAPISPMSFTVASPTPGQSYNHNTDTSETTLNNMGKCFTRIHKKPRTRLNTKTIFPGFPFKDKGVARPSYL